MFTHYNLPLEWKKKRAGFNEAVLSCHEVNLCDVCVVDMSILCKSMSILFKSVSIHPHQKECTSYSPDISIVRHISDI